MLEAFPPPLCSVIQVGLSCGCNDTDDSWALGSAHAHLLAWDLLSICLIFREYNLNVSPEVVVSSYGSTTLRTPVVQK